MINLPHRGVVRGSSLLSWGLRCRLLASGTSHSLPFGCSLPGQSNQSPFSDTPVLPQNHLDPEGRLFEVNVSDKWNSSQWDYTLPSTVSWFGWLYSIILDWYWVLQSLRKGPRNVLSDMVINHHPKHCHERGMYDYTNPLSPLLLYCNSHHPSIPMCSSVYSGAMNPVCSSPCTCPVHDAVAAQHTAF